MAEKNSYRAIGLMSGTSLDGLDMAYCQFDKTNEGWQFELLQSQSIAYEDAFRQRLADTVHLNGEDLLLLHQSYGRWLGEQVSTFVNAHQLMPDLVASHGHTVFHQPEKQFTFQIGDGQCVANAAKQFVVADFRSKDVRLGGQGAPLVPIGDRWLFGQYDYCLNLGGIANVSFEQGERRIAFDICAANMLLNHLIRPTGKSYDANGTLARSGTLHQPLFDALNTLPYFQLPFPKSLGYEWFLESVLPIIGQFELSLADQLCTAVHHIAYQLHQSLKGVAPATTATQLLATGGGAFNGFLMETIRQYLAPSGIAVVIPTPKLIEFKEAIVFAFMGVLQVRGEVNALASVTGASVDSVGGVGFWPEGV